MAKTPVDDTIKFGKYSVEKMREDEESNLSVLRFKGPRVNEEIRVYNAFDRQNVLRMLSAAYEAGKLKKQEEVWRALGIDNLQRRS